MMPITVAHLRTLEFDKVLGLLARHCTFSVSHSLAERLMPSADEAEVRHAQDATEEARRLLEVRPNTGVRGARDIRAHVRRAAIGGSLAPAELLDVAATMASARSIKTLLSRQEIRAPTLLKIARGIAQLDELEEAIQRAIDDEGRILDGASERLGRIRSNLRDAHDRLLKRLNELIVSSELRDALQDPLITMRAGRYVLPIKADFRGRVRGIVHDQSASGATLFVEPLAVVDLGNAWRQHGIEEEREVERILAELSRRVAAAQFGLMETVDALARIDLAFAMGKLALEMDATRPVLWSFDRLPDRSAVVHLVSARHPLIRAEVVPIDVELGGNFDVLLITGPNTGGKTVALKTVGLLALMAQAGLQIPAAEGSGLAIFHGVYADVGDEQSIEQSLSTFSSHITHIVDILRLADQRSIVLLDEIGAGTDPQEGSALAHAILKHLVDSRIFTIATTHYSELKSFAYLTPRVENASVEFDAETLRPTYRLTIGLPGKSNAFAIAERLAMPESIIAEASKMIHPTERRVDELLGDIESALQAARAERSDAARLRLEAERAERQLCSRLVALEEDRAAILRRAEGEAEATIAELRREADQLRRELRGLKAERERLAAIEGRIAGLRVASRGAGIPNRAGAEPGGPDSEPSDRPSGVKVGDRVRVGSLGSIGVVRAITSSGDMAEVEVGGIRVRAQTAELERTHAPATPSPRERAMAAGYLTTFEEAPASPGRRGAGGEGWSPVESQLDLRGLTTEEARYRLDRYLNDAYMEGVSVVRIVHGKGTGAVRQAVRDLLADHPLVRSHEGADPRDGGEGATVVRLAS